MHWISEQDNQENWSIVDKTSFTIQAEWTVQGHVPTNRLWFSVYSSVLPGLQVGDVLFRVSSSIRKGVWVFHATDFNGWVSYVSRTRHARLFQVEFVLDLTGAVCSVEQAANTEQRLAFRETDQEALSPSELCFYTGTAMLIREAAGF